jgi:hypothetical protein
MADNKSRGRTTDRKRLNMGEAYEVAYAKSERASPARKALLAKGEAARSARSAKKTPAKKGSARTTAGAGSRALNGSSASAKASSPKSKSNAKSAAPAMKRSSAAPRRAPAQASTRPAPKPPKEEKTADNTAPKTMKYADAVDLLTDDHLQVDALFKQYEKLARREAPADQRRTLAQTICDMLKTHTAIEEEIFYPAARRAGLDADLLDEADIEHASAKDLIAQIASGNPDDDHYDAKVKVLGEYITHHVVEEHTEMFPKCRRSSMDLVLLRGQLEERKMALQPSLAGAADGAANDGPSAKSPGLLAKIGDTLFAKT